MILRQLIILLKNTMFRSNLISSMCYQLNEYAKTIGYKGFSPLRCYHLTQIDQRDLSFQCIGLVHCWQPLHVTTEEYARRGFYKNGKFCSSVSSDDRQAPMLIPLCGRHDCHKMWRAGRDAAANYQICLKKWLDKYPSSTFFLADVQMEWTETLTVHNEAINRLLSETMMHSHDPCRFPHGLCKWLYTWLGHVTVTSSQSKAIGWYIHSV